MSFLIGGLSSQQYKAYLNRAAEEAEPSPVTHWAARFQLARYSALTVLINRIAYFLLHRLNVYPNNTYLFQKFKTHEFHEIATEEQYKVVKEIFARFRACSDLNKEELEKVEEQLTEVEERLHAKESKDKEELEKDKDVKEPIEGKEDKEVEKPEIKAESKKDKAETVEEIEQAKRTQEIERKEEADKNLEETKEELDLDADAEGTCDEEEIFDAEKDLPLVNDDKPIVLIQPAKLPIVLVTGVKSKDNLKGRTETDKEEKPPSKEHALDEEDAIHIIPEEKEDDLAKLDSVDNASKWLQELRESLSPYNKDKLDQEELVIDLPKEVVDIVSQPFPLEDPKSIDDLFQGKKSEDDQQLYRQNLNVLLSFIRQLHVENKTTGDERLATYMQQMDEAFERAWNGAYGQSATLHAEFDKAFPKQPVQLNDVGDVICTTEQLQWAAKKIAERFPAIYSLAFDAPSMNIHQKLQMARLTRAIFVGPDVHEKTLFIDSECFIRIQETVNKETSHFVDNTLSNPFVKLGSFIYTYFVGSNDKLSNNVNKLKKQFEDYTKNYVKDWLEGSGVTLMFDDDVITSGQSDEDIKAGDWVAHMRDKYTKTLKAMSPEELKAEIARAYQCPVICAIARAYADDIDAQSLINSKFPAAFMEEIFQKELRRTQDNATLHSAIRQTIDDAKFEDESDIQELAEKANISAECIEPLIRIRVFYMMGCFEQNAIKPAVKTLKKKIETMYDPAVCQKPTDSALVHDLSKKRILQFDENFDELTILIENNFFDPKKIHLAAQGKTRLTVSSISRLNSEKKPVETSLTDLEDLRCSLYSSPEQIRYLVAQVAPGTLIDNMQKLEQEVAVLELINKAKKYEEAKKAHTTGALEKVTNYISSWWSKTEVQKPFNPKDYQDIKKDRDHLDVALSKARELVTYRNIEQILTYYSELSEDQLEEFKPALDNIRNHLRTILRVLEEVYPGKDEQDKDIQAKSRELRRLIQLQPDEYGIKNVESSDSESARDPSPTSSDTDVELSLDIEDFDDEEVIGKKAGTGQKNWKNHVWDYTLGTVLNETTKAKYLSWKIERYEELIKGVQDAIIGYIDSQNLGSLDKLIQQAKKKSAPEWMHQILPILKFCHQDIRIGPDRLNPEYLEEVRKSYCHDMLAQLRQAVNWAKDHSGEEGAEHIDAICYHLYTALNINQRSQEILNTFLRLGEAALKKKINILSADSPYAMIEGLREAHEKIKAVPNDAKAPLVKQYANSLRGHLNGFMGMTSFDPNMQSNPIHVLFHKIIKKKDKTILVKDIAMGSPTIETGIGKPEIAPEFLAFLRYCQTNGLKHFYINNQDYIPKAWIKGNESDRCQALHDLAEGEFKGTLFVITLNQNSSFYQQVGHSLSGLNVETTKAEIMVQLLDAQSKEMGHCLPAHLIKDSDLHQWMVKKLDHFHRYEFAEVKDFRNEKSRDRFVERFHDHLRTYIEKRGEKLGYSIYDSSTAKFKEELIAQIFDRSPHETGNCISDDLVTSYALRDWGVEAFDQIHEKLFNDRKNLTIEERRIFIRLFYQNLSRKILIETEADSYNASCKDRIDRGAATDAEDFAYLAILADCMNELEIIEFFQMLVFARAIIVRKRTIIEERLDRLIETVKFMIDHQKRLQELQAYLFPDVEMTIDKFKLDLTDEEPFVEEESVRPLACPPRRELTVDEFKLNLTDEEESVSLLASRKTPSLTY